MKMDVSPLILNTALWGTNTSKTKRIREVGEKDKRSGARVGASLS